ncbi:MAG: hypothetical protein WC483_05620 [Candidatus Paceibacterota bacterium]
MNRPICRQRSRFLGMYSRNANIRDSKNAATAMAARDNYETDISAVVMPSCG